MPTEKSVYRQRLAHTPVHRNHELRNTLLRRSDPAMICRQPKLLLDRRLNTCAIQKLTFYLRGRHCLHTHFIDDELSAICISQMPGSSDKDAQACQKTLFRPRQAR